MDLKLFNTYTGKVQTLEPLHGNEVRMYNCGPTIYDYAHIGNFRSFLVNDILRRTLEYAGYQVVQMMNITDVDDKIIERSKKENIPLKELTRHYEQLFLADLSYLNIKVPTLLPHATDHVGSMVALIEKLMHEGYAYTTADGVYFEVSKVQNYGVLARLDLSATTESRIEGENLGKKNHRDFALWKFWTPEDGECVYDASFGKGRPGWHIECSAMAMTGLGETLDIHTGGADLIFPHHTNEIAQSEAITGKPFANLWLHTEFLMIDGQKMSKSLGNYTTLKTIIDKGYSPLAFRYYMLGTHYRSKANFTWEALDAATVSLKKLSEHLGKEIGVVNQDYQKRFLELVVNDLDTPRAIALAWEVAKNTTLSPEEKTATLLDFDRVLGFRLTLKQEEVIPENIQNLVTLREQARTEKNWIRSDELRSAIKEQGYDVKDTPSGSEVLRI